MRMTRSVIVILLLLILMGGGIAMLILKDIPAPQQPIEKELDHDRFLKP